MPTWRPWRLCRCGRPNPAHGLMRVERRGWRPMSVAALYDVHGNLPALEAVLAEIPDDATILVGGDVVAGGAQPSETLERLRALGDRIVWIRGNADRELTPGEPGLAPEGALDATRAALTDEQIAFLYANPPTVQIGRV